MVGVGGITLGILGFYTAKGSTGVVFRQIEARIAKPTLVRESSRYSLLNALNHPINFVKTLRSKPSDALQGVIFSPKLEERLRDVAIATKNTKKNRGHYPNLLLYGPPGTGEFFKKAFSKIVRCLVKRLCEAF